MGCNTEEPLIHEHAHKSADLIKVRLQTLIQCVCAEAGDCIPLHFEAVLVWEVGHSRKVTEHSQRDLVTISVLLSTSHLERAEKLLLIHHSCLTEML